MMKDLDARLSAKALESAMFYIVQYLLSKPVYY